MNNCKHLESAAKAKSDSPKPKRKPYATIDLKLVSEAFDLLLKGKTQKEIADELNFSREAWIKNNNLKTAYLEFKRGVFELKYDNQGRVLSTAKSRGNLKDGECYTD